MMNRAAGTRARQRLSESNNEPEITTMKTEQGIRDKGQGIRRRRGAALSGVLVEGPVYPGTLYARRSIALHGAILGCLDSDKLVATIERRLRKLITEATDVIGMIRLGGAYA